MSTRSPTRPILLVGALFVSACGSDAPDVRFIDDFIARSDLVECGPAPIAGRGEVLDAVALGDTALLALYGSTRELVAYDARLRPAHVVPLAREGPAGVAEPVSAALGRDGIVYIADRGARALKRLDLARGTDRGAIRLPFTPHRVRTDGGGRVLVTPLVLGDEPSWLLYAIADAEAVGGGDAGGDVGGDDGPEPTPVRVPPTRYADLTVNALANMTLPAAMPDGAVIAVHQFLVPAAFRATAPDAEPVRHALPLPDGVRATVGRVPTTPITEERLGEIATAATALGVDRARGGLLYLTRTGRADDAASEKAIVRLDRELDYERSYILDVNATQLAYLADRGIALVADEEGTWHSCPTP
ncbi:MAG: hypothetical protein ACOC8B_06540 [Gemmatimonadota bacterium]